MKEMKLSGKWILVATCLYLFLIFGVDIILPDYINFWTVCYIPYVLIKIFYEENKTEVNEDRIK